MQQHDRADLFDAPHGELPQVPVAPTGVDAFADGAGLVLRLAGLAPHTGAPRCCADAVAAARPIRISAALGLGRRTEHLDAFAVRPLDFVGVAEPAIDEMAL